MKLSVFQGAIAERESTSAFGQGGFWATAAIAVELGGSAY